MALKKITGNETPRPLRGKTSKFNRLVRFVDLNESLKEVEENFIQLPANPTTGDVLVFNGTEWVPGSVGGGNDEYQETIVEISSSDILTFGDGYDFSSQLPALNQNEYLDGYWFLEVVPTGDGYFDMDSILNVMGSYLPSDALKTSDYKVFKGDLLNKVYEIVDVPDFGGKVPVLGNNFVGYGFFMIYTLSGNNPTTYLDPSDFYLRLKIYHKTITFG